MTLSGLELGSIVSGPPGLKESGGQQSRFKWMMEGHSPAPSSPDSALHKNGLSTFCLSCEQTIFDAYPLFMINLFLGPIAAPLKRGGSPYSQYEMLGMEGLGVPLQGSSDGWQRSPGNKMGTKIGASSWPPGTFYLFSVILMIILMIACVPDFI